MVEKDEPSVDRKNVKMWFGQEIIIKEQKKRPMLTIAIPTYNRAIYLSKCLENIYSQIGDDDRFEVLVCNNDSPDNTAEIVAEYMKKYTNIVYYKNDTNIGVSRNFQKVLELSTGEYINLHGDDDYFNQNIYRSILQMIEANRNCDVMYMTVLDCELCYRRGFGLSNYQIESNTGGWATGMILNNDAYKKVVDKERFLNSNLNHIYIQLEMLRLNPNYCIMFGPITRGDCGDGGAYGYNIMEVAIQNYLNIIYSFKNNGLSEEEIAYHKLASLNITFPLINWVIESQTPLPIEQGIEIFTKYYKDEPYFNEKLAELKSIFSKKSY